MREADLIQRFLRPLTGARPEARGLSDDAAVLTPAEGLEYVISADMLLGGVHFRLEDAPADIAFKALSVNVSDIAAKGAEATGYFLTLALPSSCANEDWFAKFASGLDDAQCTYPSMHLLGGDLTATPGPLAISLTAIGQLPAGSTVSRSGANPGDIIFVSGTIGDAVLGLQHLTEAPFHSHLSAQDITCLTQRYLRPQAHLALAPVIRTHATAAMDISDGLVMDARRMAQASGAAFHIDIPKVPLSRPATRAIDLGLTDRLKLVCGGDDYEILSTIPPNHAESFEKACLEAGKIVTRIGELHPGPPDIRLRDADGGEIDLSDTPNSGGWDHFDPPAK